MKILIPMAGEGSRFRKEGYDLPKPLIPVNGKPMIQLVVENLQFDADYIFLVRKEHLHSYPQTVKLLESISGGRCNIVEVDGLTEGAACTTLLAKQFINNDDNLLIANSDQYVDYQKETFNYFVKLTSVDGMVFCFNDDNPKWSFVKLNENSYVCEVAEKKVISNIATCGIYWYRRGSDYVSGAESMIRKNIRVNNEFYIAPVYNELIQSKKSIIPFYVEKMHGLGTPEDLKTFLKL
jgi:dTDP-glucose pyrophosphorylase